MPMLSGYCLEGRVTTTRGKVRTSARVLASHSVAGNAISSESRITRSAMVSSFRVMGRSFGAIAMSDLDFQHETPFQGSRCLLPAL